MLSDASIGMKAFILDDFTINVVSAAFTQTELLQKEVFLVEKLHVNPDKKMHHLKAVVFVRPSQENIALLCDLLKANAYGEYYFSFSNILKETHLQTLAEADEHQVVRQVQEVYASFLAVDPFLFTLGTSNNHDYLSWKPPSTHSQLNAVDGVVEGLAAFLLSVKRRPVIRHQRSSEISRRVAEDVWRLAYEQESGLFDFRRSDGTLQLLVLDRMDDPVTPLLSQWTYQAMLHELVGIKNNRVNLPDSSPKETHDIVISSSDDGFFKDNMYSNYGDLGINIKKLVDNFQAVSKMNKQIDSIEDMQRFLDSFPGFRQQSGNVSKHVSLMSELSRIIGEASLMTVSQVQQDVACGSDRMYAYNSIMQQLSTNSQAKSSECLKLVLLFALRYEKEGTRQVPLSKHPYGSSEGAEKLATFMKFFQVDEMVAALAHRNVEDAHLTLVKEIVRWAGQERRTGDLFGNHTFFARASKMVGGLKGADNVYTQHQPLLVQTLENLSKGKMKETDYPFVNAAHGPKDAKPQDVLVFVIGGVTYEEARFVAQMNEYGQGFHITLGGTTILNSRSFLQDMIRALC
eukprot:CAMPEP_0197586184 /NCGR_PEP_ID=MMETSP1326-20131121/8240_1 /TAXON_ID=1155430 /ORGANISM="Genus nov. species nov., Strain RCC2288" /LENGTH=572 /DNA_ID=CAMNT_0043150777 /DNA_START=220 /DNA_END=1938 /DNA_ORIENTATION=-